MADGQSARDEPAALQPLLAHLYGTAISRVIAREAVAKPGERVVIVGADIRGATGWSAADPQDKLPGIDSDDHEMVTDPLPIIEFPHGRDTNRLRATLAAGWDVLVGFPPQEVSHKAGLGDFLDVLMETASPNSRAFLLLASGTIARHDPRTRERLLGSGRIRTLVFSEGTQRVKRSGPVGIPTSLPAVLVHLDPSHEQTGRHARGVQVLQVNSGTGDATHFITDLGPDQRWTFAALDPERARRVELWSREGGAQRLTEIAELPRRESKPGDQEQVLSPRQITARGIDLEVETEGGRGERDLRAVQLQPGDIVGRTLGDPHWTLVSPEHAGLLAPRQVYVLRPKEVDPRYLLAFLQSDAARLQLEAASVGATVARVSPSGLRELLVPILPVPADAIRDDDPIREFRSVSEQLADELEGRYRAAFDHPAAASVTASLIDAAEDAAMAHDLLRSVTDPLNRAREFLPHPLARTIRVMQNHQRAGSQVDVYHDLLRFGETAVVLLGAVGLAYMSHRRGDEPPEPWQISLARGGVALGTWLECANTAAERARRSGESLGGVASALSTNSPLNKVLSHFVSERNDQAHGAGPRSPFEYEQKIIELEELLAGAVEHLAPLARSDWFIVEGLAWSGEKATFAVHGRSLKGDHPDFETWTQERVAPLESGVVYVLLGDMDLPMTGYCMLHSCPRCLHEELYYPDRVRGSLVRLRSLDRGHQIDVALEEARLPIVTK